jgi:hypothetical protein
VYLGDNPDLAVARPNNLSADIFTRAWFQNTLGALLNNHPCVMVGENTNAATEALQLSMLNASVIASGSSDAAQRMYRCLYGVGSDGSTIYASVPPRVSTWRFLQRFLSAIFIFLFGLGVRNMLKMK